MLYTISRETTATGTTETKIAVGGGVALTGSTSTSNTQSPLVLLSSSQKKRGVLGGIKGRESVATTGNM
jgi:hypothetical protein